MRPLASLVRAATDLIWSSTLAIAAPVRTQLTMSRLPARRHRRGRLSSSAPSWRRTISCRSGISAAVAWKPVGRGTTVSQSMRRISSRWASLSRSVPEPGIHHREVGAGAFHVRIAASGG